MSSPFDLTDGQIKENELACAEVVKHGTLAQNNLQIICNEMTEFLNKGPWYQSEVAEAVQEWRDQLEAIL